MTPLKIYNRLQLIPASYSCEVSLLSPTQLSLAMAGPLATSTTSAIAQEHTLNVKILSQLPSPYGTIHFTALPIATTVGQLKIRIRDHVGSDRIQDTSTASTLSSTTAPSPFSTGTAPNITGGLTVAGSVPAGSLNTSAGSTAPVEHQRLIYRGRVMARDEQTLLDVFGKETVAQGGTHNLHLVIKEAQVPLPALGGGERVGGRQGNPAGVAFRSYPLPLLQQNTARPNILHTQNGAAVIQQTPFAFAPGLSNGVPYQPGVVFPQMMPQMPQMQQMPHHMPNAHIHQQQVAGANPHAHHLAAQTTPQFYQQQHNEPQVPQLQARPQGGAQSANDEQLALFQQRVAHAQQQQALLAHRIAMQQHQLAMTSMAMTSMQGVNGLVTPIAQNPGQIGDVPPTQHIRISQTVHSFQPDAQQLERPATAPTVQDVHQPNDGEGEVVDVQEVAVPYDATTSLSALPQPQHPLPFAFSVPHQNPMGFLQVPQNQSVPQNAGNMQVIVARGSSPTHSQHPPTLSTPLYPLGVPPMLSFYGPVHTINSMRNYDDDLVDLNLRILRLIGASDRTERQAVDGVLNQVQQLIRFRNAAQNVVNNVMVRTQVTATGLTATDVATLQDLNHRFGLHASEVFQNINRLRSVASTSEVPRVVNLTDDATAEFTPAATTTPSSQSISSTTTMPATRESNVTVANGQPSDSTPITTYLLYDPTGLHAVVFERAGTFSGSASSIPSLSSQHHGPAYLAPHLPTQRLRHEYRNVSDNSRGNGSPLENEPPNDDPQHEQPPQPIPVQGLAQNRGFQDPLIAQAQAVQAQVQQEAGGDLVRILVPFFRGFWLLIRVFGFIYLFTSGHPSRRTMMMGVAAAVVFAAQAGLFGNRWDWLRRHLEGLIGVPGDVGAGQQRQDAPAGAQDGQLQRNGVTRRNAQPDPQETAARLLRERPETGIGRVRGILTTIERTLALFLASLYPGLGERHVAARRRLEAQAREAQDQLHRPTEGGLRDAQPDLDRAHVERVVQDAQIVLAEGEEISASLQEARINLESVRDRIGRHRGVKSQERAGLDGATVSDDPGEGSSSAAPEAENVTKEPREDIEDTTGSRS